MKDDGNKGRVSRRSRENVFFSIALRGGDASGGGASARLKSTEKNDFFVENREARPTFGRSFRRDRRRAVPTAIAENRSFGAFLVSGLFETESLAAASTIKKTGARRYVEERMFRDFTEENGA